MQQAVLGVTRDRMLREMVESVEILTTGKPMLLVLEDLHWADYSTVDLLSSLAHRHEPACLLLIGTYRPSDAKLPGHPVHMRFRSCSARGLCQELSLPFPRQRRCRRVPIVAIRGRKVSAGLARILHHRTEGNPLFLTRVVDHWMPLGLLEKPPEQLSLNVPDTLRELMDRQLAVITPGEQATLEAASVVGREFAAAAVSGAVEQTEEEVEGGLRCLGEAGSFS